MRHASQTGFTLLELMITVTIVAILSAIAIPQFADYTKRGKIPEAVATLSDLRIQLERFFADNRSYAGFVAAAPGTRYFAYACATAPSTYLCTATGITGMAGFEYTVNQSNVKTSTISVSGWGNSPTCWISKKGEVC